MHAHIHTCFLRESDPVSTGAVLVHELLELGILLGRPRPFLHVVLVATWRPSHQVRPVDVRKMKKKEEKKKRS
jgi:hypothetical protein